MSPYDHNNRTQKEKFTRNDEFVALNRNLHGKWALPVADDTLNSETELSLGTAFQGVRGVGLRKLKHQIVLGTLR